MLERALQIALAEARERGKHLVMCDISANIVAGRVGEREGQDAVMNERTSNRGRRCQAHEDELIAICSIMEITIKRMLSTQKNCSRSTNRKQRRGVGRDESEWREGQRRTPTKHRQHGVQRKHRHHHSTIRPASSQP